VGSKSKVKSKLQDDQLKLNPHGTILEGRSIGLDQKKRAQRRRAHDLENEDES